MSKTPITDAVARTERIVESQTEWVYREVVDAQVARRLEEDRAELVEALRKILNANDAPCRFPQDSEPIKDARALLSRLEHK